MHIRGDGDTQYKCIGLGTSSQCSGGFASVGFISVHAPGATVIALWRVIHVMQTATGNVEGEPMMEMNMTTLTQPARALISSYKVPPQPRGESSICRERPNQVQPPRSGKNKIVITQPGAFLWNRDGRFNQVQLRTPDVTQQSGAGARTPLQPEARSRYELVDECSR